MADLYNFTIRINLIILITRVALVPNRDARPALAKCPVELVSPLYNLINLRDYGKSEPEKQGVFNESHIQQERKCRNQVKPEEERKSI